MAAIIPGASVGTAGATTNPFAIGGFTFGLDGNGFPNGSAMPWITYTPTISGTGWALGNGTLTGLYSRIGTTTIFVAGLNFGSTTTAGAGPLGLSLPVTPDGDYLTADCKSFDNSAGTLYFNSTYIAGIAATPVVLGALGALSAYFTTTSPFTWAVNDLVNITGIYRGI